MKKRFILLYIFIFSSLLIAKEPIGYMEFKLGMSHEDVVEIIYTKYSDWDIKFRMIDNNGKIFPVATNELLDDKIIAARMGYFLMHNDLGIIAMTFTNGTQNSGEFEDGKLNTLCEVLLLNSYKDELSAKKTFDYHYKMLTFKYNKPTKTDKNSIKWVIDKNQNIYLDFYKKNFYGVKLSYQNEQLLKKAREYFKIIISIELLQAADDY